jgi:hypothetical protein
MKLAEILLTKHLTVLELGYFELSDIEAFRDMYVSHKPCSKALFMATPGENKRQICSLWTKREIGNGITVPHGRQ